MDNPEKLESMVNVSNAKSTEILKPENVHNLCEKCKTTSEKWSVTADRLWDSSDNN